jgi:hypothetical protein
MKKIYFILATAVVVTYSSCTTTMYVPNTVNAPLLKEKGEIKINADQKNLQVAAAISDHVGIMVNGFYTTYRGNNNYEHKGGLAEIGLGYYRPMANHLVTEAFAGVGLGEVSKFEELSDSTGPYTASFHANATRFFVQPEIGYSNKIFDIVFSPRFSFVKYNSFNYSNYTPQQLQRDYLDNGQLTSNLFVFAEPAVTARFGYKWIKLQLQYGFTTNIGEGRIRYSDNFTSAGVVIDIAKWYND